MFRYDFLNIWTKVQNISLWAGLWRLTVLPGLEATPPPIEQKSTAIWQKLTAISNFYKIPLFFRYF
jgi:hypothetical protein